MFKQNCSEKFGIQLKIQSYQRSYRTIKTWNNTQVWVITSHTYDIFDEKYFPVYKYNSSIVAIEKYVN